MIQHDLIDEYRLWFHPVVLGSGKRLFPEGKPPLALKLIETKTTSTGVVIHVYQPAGKPELGSFAPGRSDHSDSLVLLSCTDLPDWQASYCRLVADGQAVGLGRLRYASDACVPSADGDFIAMTASEDS